ncbi:RarD protein [Saprolegnia parasitica CBS 223.65]|uniref:RarD protein n=1 Tax=Saprolegnia parasitica (strain CBS 223.65) TaxID=695850 RepID=A0A067CQ10_SAPPC|nr:RarD protein [Saprolegnia parasitica CBS 223.65]KDO28611.1 RarD protein [Saprolegnia parasitica CBS 223.65]|eukprot:XP_012200674.1 RarD protein [Saprolegnia parasitica CBS 223.65]
MQTGIIYASTAYVIWGVLPMYWKQLETVPAEQLALHRIVWSFLVLLLVLAVKGDFKAFRAAARGWRVFAVYTIASIIILSNWVVYIWAVNAGYVVETSLGYFITPLVNVVVAVVVFKEKLRLWQWLAITLAFGGVLVIAIAYATFPWIALTLGTTFSLYGVVKKQAPLSALHGMTVETGILFVPAVIYLSVVQGMGSGAFLHVDTLSHFLLVGAGVVTVIPMVLFASAAQSIPFSLLGVLHYIGPSLMFVIGVLVYNEAFSTFKLIGFILVWVALAIYSTEGIVAHQQSMKQKSPVGAADEAGDGSTPYARV